MPKVQRMCSENHYTISFPKSTPNTIPCDQDKDLSIKPLRHNKSLNVVYVVK